MFALKKNKFIFYYIELYSIKNDFFIIYFTRDVIIFWISGLSNLFCKIIWQNSNEKEKSILMKFLEFFFNNIVDYLIIIIIMYIIINIK